MFLGEYRHQLDAKNRFRLPTKFKTALESGAIITKGTNGCLFVFSKDSAQELIFDKIKAVPLADSSALKPLRIIFSSAQELEEDNQGRALLSKALRDHAKIVKDIVFIGVGNRAEIWAKEVYDEYMQDADFDVAVEKLREYNI